MFSTVPALVSNSSTDPRCDAADAVWSIGPHGTPTKSFSACWASRAISRASSLTPDSTDVANVVTHSTAADEDSPAPDGTWESSARSKPPTGWPAWRSAQIAPTR